MADDSGVRTTAMGLPLKLCLLAAMTAVASEHERHLDVSKDSGPPYLIVPVTGIVVDTDLIADRMRVPLDRKKRASYTLVTIPLSRENVCAIDKNDNTPTFPSPSMHVELWRTLHGTRNGRLTHRGTWTWARMSQRYAIVDGYVNNAFKLSS